MKNNIAHSTLVVGASLNDQRYSHKAILTLRKNDIPTYALGLKSGIVGDVNIETEWKKFTDIHTVTIYMNPKRQEEVIEPILALSPKRIIFNPGTENLKFQELALAQNIEVLEACTLVMLNTGQY